MVAPTVSEGEGGGVVLAGAPVDVSGGARRVEVVTLPLSPMGAVVVAAQGAAHRGGGGAALRRQSMATESSGDESLPSSPRSDADAAVVQSLWQRVAATATAAAAGARHALVAFGRGGQQLIAEARDEAGAAVMGVGSAGWAAGLGRDDAAVAAFLAAPITWTGLPSRYSRRGIASRLRRVSSAANAAGVADQRARLPRHLPRVRVDAAPFEVSDQTPVPKVHLLLVMCLASQLHVTRDGRLCGVVLREDLAGGGGAGATGGATAEQPEGVAEAAASSAVGGGTTGLETGTVAPLPPPPPPTDDSSSSQAQV